MIFTLRRVDEFFHRHIWLGIFQLLLLVLVIYGPLVFLSLDRRVPFRMLQVHPAAAKAGEHITISADVWRDMSRRCDVTMARSIAASGNVGRFDLGGQDFSADDIAALEQASPGKLRVSFEVPPDRPVGDNLVTTSLWYRCNKGHTLLWPVYVRTEMPFRVLPP